MRRVNIRQILCDPEKRKKLLVGAGLFLQHSQGIMTTYEQMAAAYDKVQKEKKKRELSTVRRFRRGFSCV